MAIPKTNPRHDAAQAGAPIPAHGAGRVFYVLTTHFTKLLRCNLLFVLFSLPVITLPAALAGMAAVIQALYRDGHCFLWDTFFREFRTDFLRRTLWALVLAAVPAAGWLAGSLLSETAAYLTAAIPLVLVLLAGGYWFPQLASLRLTSGQCLKNALLLTIIEVKPNFLLLVIECVSGALTIVAWPFSAPLAALLLPALTQLLITAVVNPVLEARVIREDA